MKTNIILLAAVMIVMASCNSDRTKEFIPGTYVDHSESEYSTASDTLVIRVSEGNNFKIYRKTGFQRITEGKPGKHEYETEEWNAVYDSGTKSLIETGKGKIIAFYPDSNKLLLGKRSYKKIRTGLDESH